jgi:hypothetical protein
MIITIIATTTRLGDDVPNTFIFFQKKNPSQKGYTTNIKKKLNALISQQTYEYV